MVTMTAQALTTSSVRATFSEQIDPTDLILPASWSISPSLSINSIVLNDDIAVDYVTLYTSRQTGGQLYTLTLLFDPEVYMANWKVQNVAVDTTAVAGDGPRAYFNVDSSGGARQITLPVGATMPPGDEIAVRRLGANLVTVVRQAGDLINGAASYVINNDKETVILVWNAANSEWMAT